MLLGFSPIFEADTKIINGYDFAAPLKESFQELPPTYQNV